MRPREAVLLPEHRRPRPPPAATPPGSRSTPARLGGCGALAGRGKRPEDFSHGLLAGCGETACGTSWMTCRTRSVRENRRFSFVGKRPEDFSHGLFGNRWAASRHPSRQQVAYRWDRWKPAPGSIPKGVARQFGGGVREGAGPGRTVSPRPAIRSCRQGRDADGQIACRVSIPGFERPAPSPASIPGPRRGTPRWPLEKSCDTLSRQEKLLFSRELPGSLSTASKPFEHVGARQTDSRSPRGLVSGRPADRAREAGSRRPVAGFGVAVHGCLWAFRHAVSSCRLGPRRSGS